MDHANFLEVGMSIVSLYGISVNNSYDTIQIEFKKRDSNKSVTKEESTFISDIVGHVIHVHPDIHVLHLKDQNSGENLALCDVVELIAWKIPKLNNIHFASSISNQFKKKITTLEKYQKKMKKMRNLY